MTEHSPAHAGTKRPYAADRTTQVQVRVTLAERDAYDAAAEAAGVSRSEWLRALAAEALLPREGVHVGEWVRDALSEAMDEEVTP